MIVRELLETVDAIKENQIPDSLKFRWINDVEGRVHCEIKRQSPESFKAIVSEDEALTVPEPYASLYTLFLVSMIEFAQGNYSDFARLTVEFEKNLEIYAKWYIRSL